MSDHESPSVLTGLCVTAVASLLVLLLTEVVVRVSGVAPRVAVIQVGRFRLSENPRIGYEPAPTLSAKEHGPSYDEHGFGAYQDIHNSMGYRDYEHSREKEGTYRIVVLGDSIAAGFGLERYEDTFPSHLEADLRERGVLAEVINFGVPGYNTDQEVETLKARGLAFDPDLILLAYSLNDHHRLSSRILRSLREDQKQRGVVNRLATHRWLTWSALYRYVRFQVLDGFDGGEDKPIRGALTADMLEGPFGRLAALARKNEIPVMVAVFPRFQQLFEYAWEGEHALVAKASQRYGFFYLDLLQGYRDCWSTRPFRLARDSWHPSIAGHRCAARAMTAFILESVRPRLQAD